jgi:hypothetical protein
MNGPEFSASLVKLRLTHWEAATLLSTSVRTVSRWAESAGEVPGPVEAAVRAWVRLQEHALPWRADDLSVLPKVADSKLAEHIAAYRNHAIDLARLLERVKARGGPAAPWQVELRNHEATLGPIRVSFYRLHDGGFSPQSYSRRDNVGPDLVRDHALLEDAWYCVAQAIAEEQKRKKK